MQKNDYTTLISLRLENKTLNAINEFTKRHYYLKRSSVINQALQRLFVEHGYGNLYNFLYCKDDLKK